jgi:hypothetical protein
MTCRCGAAPFDYGKRAHERGRRKAEGEIKYLFLLYADSPMPEPGTARARAMLEDWTEARQAMADAGVLIDCAPLQPAAASTTVRVRDGEALLTDGPAAEIKEVFGGFTLVECAGQPPLLADRHGAAQGAGPAAA